MLTSNKSVTWQPLHCIGPNIHPRVYGCLGVHEYCTMWFSFEVWLHHSTNSLSATGHFLWPEDEGVVVADTSSAPIKVQLSHAWQNYNTVKMWCQKLSFRLTDNNLETNFNIQSNCTPAHAQSFIAYTSDNDCMLKVLKHQVHTHMPQQSNRCSVKPRLLTHIHYRPPNLWAVYVDYTEEHAGKPWFRMVRLTF